MATDVEHGRPAGGSGSTPDRRPVAAAGSAPTSAGTSVSPLLSLLVLFPVYMLLVRALSNPLDYVAQGLPLYPVGTEWDVFGRAFTEADLGRAMGLSLVVTLIIVIAQLLTSVLAAYAFAFLEFPLKRLLFAIVVATLLLPIEVTLVANLQTCGT